MRPAAWIAVASISLGVVPLTGQGQDRDRQTDPSYLIWTAAQAQQIGRSTRVNVRALSGAFRRDYDYEVFWVVFPLVTETGKPLFPESVVEAELVVRIYNKEGRVNWPVPESIRRRPRTAGR